METLTIVLFLIILKLTGVITVSWCWVLFPIWGAFVIIGGFLAILFLYMVINENLFKTDKNEPPPYDMEGIIKIRKEMNKNE